MTAKTTLISHDHLIRPKLKTYLRTLLDGRFADEMNVGGARIDLAVIGDALHGFEIKAENDTFFRFDYQRLGYELAFDFLTLVTTLKKGEKIRDELPSYWGLLVACEEAGAVDFWEVRKAALNPHKHAMGALSLLWRAEIAAFPGEPRWARGVKNDAVGMRRRIQEFSDMPTINAYVCQCLKARENWRGEDGRNIAPRRVAA